jgi:hypothetical protein
VGRDTVKFTIKVFPFPGGPKRRIPLQGARSPVNSVGLMDGRMTLSSSAFLAASFPLILESLAFVSLTIVDKISSPNFELTFRSIIDLSFNLSNFEVALLMAAEGPFYCAYITEKQALKIF